MWSQNAATGTNEYMRWTVGGLGYISRYTTEDQKSQGAIRAWRWQTCIIRTIGGVVHFTMHRSTR